jgi:hypothetical protein
MLTASEDSSAGSMKPALVPDPCAVKPTTASLIPEPQREREHPSGTSVSTF